MPGRAGSAVAPSRCSLFPITPAPLDPEPVSGANTGLGSDGAARPSLVVVQFGMEIGADGWTAVAADGSAGSTCADVESVAESDVTRAPEAGMAVGAPEPSGTSPEDG